MLLPKFTFAGGKWREWASPQAPRHVAHFLRGKLFPQADGNALAGRVSDLDDIETFLRAHYTPLHAPLILISQAQRSGGTLLSQLLDAHPAIAAHPNELVIGYPSHEDWPPLDPRLGADENFRMLFEEKKVKLIRQGYTKGDKGSRRYPYFLAPRIQLHLFRHLFQTDAPSNRRDILDLYFTSFFNAWLNHQGTLQGKRWIAAFAPRLAHDASSVAGYFDSYPEGRLIQLIRDPYTWYPSAKNHRRSRKLALEQILDVWCDSVEAILRNKARYGDAVIVLRFEDLVNRTEQVMRGLATELGISFHPILLQPSFNGQPMRANSSFEVEASGVITAPLTREAMLSNAEKRFVEERCRGLYERCLLELS